MLQLITCVAERWVYFIVSRYNHVYNASLLCESKENSKAVKLCVHWENYSLCSDTWIRRLLIKTGVFFLYSRLDEADAHIVNVAIDHNKIYL